MGASDPVMYLDSDHDNVFDYWYNSGITEFSGVEEPFIYTPTAKSTGDDLDNTDEVLQGVSGITWWNVDFNRWYSYDCSECHFNNPPSFALL